jgi:hypothetical protein
MTYRSCPVSWAVGPLEVRVFGIRVMASSAPMPIAAVKLIDKEDAFILDIAIHPVAVSTNELRV